MLVDPFRFGIGVGIAGTIVFEMIALIIFTVHSSKNKEKTKNEATEETK